ncbi:MAG: VTT domain-containing protein [Minisyncoccia bacterium]
MEHLLTNLISYFGYYSYAILFLIIFFESFPLTFYLPGDSLLFTTGFLASQGHFNIGTLMITLFIASILGYIFSYIMGEKLRSFILRSNDKYWFKKKHLEYTEGFFNKYGDKTIIIGRFVPIVRSFAPTLAGTADMKFRRFIRDSITGAIFWVSGITSAGYYLGRTIPGADKYLTPIIMLIILISLSPSVIEYIRHRNRKMASKKINYE